MLPHQFCHPRLCPVLLFLLKPFPLSLPELYPSLSNFDLHSLICLPEVYFTELSVGCCFCNCDFLISSNSFFGRFLKIPFILSTDSQIENTHPLNDKVKVEKPLNRLLQNQLLIESDESASHSHLSNLHKLVWYLPQYSTSSDDKRSVFPSTNQCIPRELVKDAV